LHGVCGLTTNGCGHFEGAPGWLVCPQANHRCGNGGSSWGGSVADKIATVDAALDAARARWPESTRAPVILVGFSQGAYVAMDLARAQPGRFAGLLLLGADTGQTGDAFRVARLRRVALACGAYDMMFPKMRATPAALAPSGILARFASLGEVGHTYVARDGTDAVLTSLLEWVAAGADEAAADDVQASR
jgi:pimeloyl-ACP methyl ester carboxylesterase